jgi:branched-chain amino acid transport system ATP-binding protein
VTGQVGGGLLEGLGIVVRHGGLVAVDAVDLRAEPGKVTAVIGPNGAGKTTLFDCLAGARRPDAGRVLLDGVDVSRLSADERSRAGLARTFQRSSVFSSLTVEENLEVGAENRRRQGAIRGLLGFPDRDGATTQATVAEVIVGLGLGAVRHVTAGRLPTGTLRIVELARALCTRPRVVLLDEPASGLDDGEVDRFRRLISGLADGGLSVLLVEHDMDLVQAVAHVVYAMAGGKVLASGTPAEIVARDDVRTLVLGTAR